MLKIAGYKHGVGLLDWEKNQLRDGRWLLLATICGWKQAGGMLQPGAGWEGTNKNTFSFPALCESKNN